MPLTRGHNTEGLGLRLLVGMSHEPCGRFGILPLTIGKYTRSFMLGHGSGGAVYLAEETGHPGHRVALKVIVDPGVRTITDECEKLGRVHRSISGARGAEAFVPWLPEMELEDYQELEGGEVRQAGIIRPLCKSVVKQKLEQQGLENVLRAACALHHAGIVHRDVRLPNMLEREVPQGVVLIDLGFAVDIGTLVDEKEARVAFNVAPPECRLDKYVAHPAQDLSMLLRTHLRCRADFRECSHDILDKLLSRVDPLMKKLVACSNAAAQGQMDAMTTAFGAEPTVKELMMELEEAARGANPEAVPAAGGDLIKRWSWYAPLAQLFELIFQRAEVNYRLEPTPAASAVPAAAPAAAGAPPPAAAGGVAGGGAAAAARAAARTGAATAAATGKQSTGERAAKRPKRAKRR